VSKADTWMPLYIGDYLRDTQKLQAEQHGAYLLLILEAWTHDGRIPTDPEELSTIARVPLDRWQSHTAAKVLPFFRQCGDSYVHDRVAQELERARSNFEQKSRAGAAGAAARWQKDSSRIADACDRHAPANASSPSPSPISSPTGKNNSRATRALTVDQLMADGLIESAAAEFLALRKRKRAPLTARAWDGIKREAVRAGWSIQAAVDKCLTRGWQSFDAAWVSTTSADGMTAKDREHLRVIEGLTGRSRNAANIIDA
jgi:uncharacterized protein YdaU (DUF1376 family)